MKKLIENIMPGTTFITMFGGLGCFINNEIYGLIINDRFYIRSSNANISYYKKIGWLRHSYSKKKYNNTLTRYFRVPEEYLDCDKKLLSLITLELRQRSHELTRLQEDNESKLNKLPNIQRSLERKLKGVGIKTVEDLKSTGAVQVYSKLKEIEGDSLRKEILFCLEGAIRGVRKEVIPKHRKEELISYLN
ncbi:TfoX/Sxy family DNA transformation protein [Vibrio paucivorans]